MMMSSKTFPLLLVFPCLHDCFFPRQSFVYQRFLRGTSPFLFGSSHVSLGRPKLRLIVKSISELFIGRIRLSFSYCAHPIATSFQSLSTVVIMSVSLKLAHYLSCLARTFIVCRQLVWKMSSVHIAISFPSICFHIVRNWRHCFSIIYIWFSGLFFFGSPVIVECSPSSSDFYYSYFNFFTINSSAVIEIPSYVNSLTCTFRA